MKMTTIVIWDDCAGYFRALNCTGTAPSVHR